MGRIPCSATTPAHQHRHQRCRCHRQSGTRPSRENLAGQQHSQHRCPQTVLVSRQSQKPGSRGSRQRMDHPPRRRRCPAAARHLRCRRDRRPGRRGVPRSYQKRCSASLPGHHRRADPQPQARHVLMRGIQKIVLAAPPLAHQERGSRFSVLGRTRTPRRTVRINRQSRIRLRSTRRQHLPLPHTRAEETRCAAMA